LFQIILKYASAFADGLSVTLKLSILIWTIGLVAGGIFGAVIGFARPTFQRATKYIFLGITSVPVIVALFWFHYPIQYQLGISLDPFYTAVFVIAIYNVLVVTGIVSTAVKHFPRQYLDTATTNGIYGRIALQNIMLPLVLRQALPALLVSQINALHMTLFTSLISVEELFRVAQRVNAIEYRPVEIFTALALFFFAACFPILLVADHLEQRYKRDLSEK
jgi:ABC-type amino acid transport system permease subunit